MPSTITFEAGTGGDKYRGLCGTSVLIRYLHGLIDLSKDQLREIIRSLNFGIPHYLRGLLWCDLLEVDVNADDTSYEAFMRDPKLDELNQRVIRGDVERTRASLPVFQSLENRGMMEKMLTFYCRSTRQKYVQGQNELLAPFLLLQPGIAGYNVYQCFTSFIARYLYQMFSDANFSVLQCTFLLFAELLIFHDPILNYFLKSYMLTPELYITSWILTLFASKMELHILYCFWDLYISENDSLMILFFSLALLISHRERIMETEVSQLPETVSRLSVDSFHKLHELWSVALFLRDSTPTSFSTRIHHQMEFGRGFDEFLLELENEEAFHVLPEEILLGNCTFLQCKEEGERIKDYSALKNKKVFFLDLRSSADRTASGILPLSISIDVFGCWKEAVKSILQSSTSNEALKNQKRDETHKDTYRIESTSFFNEISPDVSPATSSFISSNTQARKASQTAASPSQFDLFDPSVNAVSSSCSEMQWMRRKGEPLYVFRFEERRFVNRQELAEIYSKGDKKQSSIKAKVKALLKASTPKKTTPELLRRTISSPDFLSSSLQFEGILSERLSINKEDASSLKIGSVDDSSHDDGKVFGEKTPANLDSTGNEDINTGGTREFEGFKGLKSSKKSSFHEEGMLENEKKIKKKECFPVSDIGKSLNLEDMLDFDEDSASFDSFSGSKRFEDSKNVSSSLQNGQESPPPSSSSDILGDKERNNEDVEHSVFSLLDLNLLSGSLKEREQLIGATPAPSRVILAKDDINKPHQVKEKESFANKPLNEGSINQLLIQKEGDFAAVYGVSEEVSNDALQGVLARGSPNTEHQWEDSDVSSHPRASLAHQYCQDLSQEKASNDAQHQSSHLVDLFDLSQHHPCQTHSPLKPSKSEVSSGGREGSLSISDDAFLKGLSGSIVSSSRVFPFNDLNKKPCVLHDEALAISPQKTPSYPNENDALEDLLAPWTTLSSSAPSQFEDKTFQVAHDASSSRYHGDGLSSALNYPLSTKLQYPSSSTPNYPPPSGSTNEPNFAFFTDGVPLEDRALPPSASKNPSHGEESSISCVSAFPSDLQASVANSSSALTSFTSCLRRSHSLPSLSSLPLAAFSRSDETVLDHSVYINLLSEEDSFKKMRFSQHSKKMIKQELDAGNLNPATRNLVAGKHQRVAFEDYETVKKSDWKISNDGDVSGYSCVPKSSEDAVEPSNLPLETLKNGSDSLNSCLLPNLQGREDISPTASPSSLRPNLLQADFEWGNFISAEPLEHTSASSPSSQEQQDPTPSMKSKAAEDGIDFSPFLNDKLKGDYSSSTYLEGDDYEETSRHTHKGNSGYYSFFYDQICLMGASDYLTSIEQEVYMFLTLELSMRHISIVKGGFKACHDLALLRELYLADHNSLLCSICTEKNTGNSRKSVGNWFGGGQFINRLVRRVSSLDEGSNQEEEGKGGGAGGGLSPTRGVAQNLFGAVKRMWDINSTGTNITNVKINIQRNKLNEKSPPMGTGFRFGYTEGDVDFSDPLGGFQRAALNFYLGRLHGGKSSKSLSTHVALELLFLSSSIKELNTHHSFQNGNSFFFGCFGLAILTSTRCIPKQLQGDATDSSGGVSSPNFDQNNLGGSDNLPASTFSSNYLGKEAYFANKEEHHGSHRHHTADFLGESSEAAASSTSQEKYRISASKTSEMTFSGSNFREVSALAACLETPSFSVSTDQIFANVSLKYFMRLLRDFTSLKKSVTHGDDSLQNQRSLESSSKASSYEVLPRGRLFSPPERFLSAGASSGARDETGARERADLWANSQQRSPDFWPPTDSPTSFDGLEAGTARNLGGRPFYPDYIPSSSRPKGGFSANFQASSSVHLGNVVERPGRKPSSEVPPDRVFSRPHGALKEAEIVKQHAPNNGYYFALLRHLEFLWLSLEDQPCFIILDKNYLSVCRIPKKKRFFVLPKMQRRARGRPMKACAPSEVFCFMAGVCDYEIACIFDDSILESEFGKKNVFHEFLPQDWRMNEGKLLFYSNNVCEVLFRLPVEAVAKITSHKDDQRLLFFYLKFKDSENDHILTRLPWFICRCETVEVAQAVVSHVKEAYKARRKELQSKASKVS